MVGAKGTLIQPADLSFPFLPGPAAQSTDEDSMEDIEKAHIQKILDRTSGNIAQAAGILKISRLTLYNKIQKYKLKK
jgi:transcriptional regulator of acetoin/glycerol metabolism